MYQLKLIPVILLAGLSMQACLNDLTSTTGSADSMFRTGQANIDCSDVITYNETHYGVALLIIQHGMVVCEDYAPGMNATMPHALFSGTKGLNGLMAAAAAADGMLTLDELVSETLTEWKEDPFKARMTIRQLLSLSSGMATTGPRAAPGFADAAATPGQFEPGTHFAYGPLVFQTFGEVMLRKLMAQGSGESPTDYLTRRVLTPISASIYAWGGPTAGTDPNLAAGAQMSAASWAKVGDLVLRPAEAIRIGLDANVYAAQFQPQGAYAGYGLTWWLATPLAPAIREGLDPVARSIDLPQGAYAGIVPEDLVIAAGAGGQRLYVSRSLDLVAVRFADEPGLAGRFQAAQSNSNTTGSAAVRPAAFSDTEFVRQLLTALPGR